MSGTESILDTGYDRKNFFQKLKGLSWKQRVLTAYLIFIGVAVVINMGLLIARRFPPAHEISSSTRAIGVSSDPGCPLKCGNHGVCKFQNQDEKKNPACLCDVAYGTFPGALCGFDTASGLDANGNTISNCSLTDGTGRLFVNPDGPCSYKRVG